ncbi:MAG: hypothetical protein HXX08_25095 [Chloroflexi bacterium]|uniref:Uncharacterized protein n=1 Tax=Candidatus Chlorohelix allophototropha TaxID=3003348 RepID=A0A8T7MAH3_9CHLR|nr:hypothetical protein [Chloroflexota bacterium]
MFPFVVKRAVRLWFDGSKVIPPFRRWEETVDMTKFRELSKEDLQSAGSGHFLP